MALSTHYGVDWTDFNELQRDMERMMNFAFGDSRGALTERGGRTLANFKPKVDVCENDKQIKVIAELPGLKPEDIKLEFRDGVLELSGKKEETHEDKGTTWHRSERTWGSFMRRIPLPEGVDHNKLKACYKNGVLEICVDKPEQRKEERHQIQINAAP